MKKKDFVVTVQKEDLIKALKLVYKSVPNNPQLPVLSSILLSIKEGRLSLSSTDLYFGTQSKITISSAAQHTIAVPGILFKEVISSLDDELIKLEIKNQGLVIRSNGGVIKIPTQNPADFPEFPKIKSKKLTLTQSIIEEINKFVCIAAGVDQARPILTTLLLKIVGGKLIAVSTDGFRLSVLEVEGTLENGVLDQEILIPAKYFSEICQIATTYQAREIEFYIEESLKQLMVKIGENKVYIRQIEGEYPPYEKIIPDEGGFTYTISIDREQLRKEVLRASIFSKHESGVVGFELGGELKENEMVIQSISSLKGSYRGVVAIKKEGAGEMKTAFNSDYIKDFLNISEVDTIEIQVTEELKPAVFRVVGKKNFKYVVMPFRVNQ